MSKKLTTLAVAAGFAIPSLGLQAAPVDATNTLPDAKPGQCYAKVMVPARYEAKDERVMVREAAEKIETIPAKYESVQKTITTSAAATRLIPVPATYEKVTEKVEVSPQQRVWMTSMQKNAIPVNPSMLDIVKASGINLAETVPGMCFKEYYQPAQFKTQTKDMLVKEAAEKVEAIPAKFEVVEEQVLIKEASKKIVEVPATYKTVSEKVLLEPAKTVWKKGNGLIERVDNTTGEIMCLVEVPARYKTIEKQVIDKPATIKEVEVPAVYKTVKVSKLASKPQEQRTAIDKVFKKISRQVKVADASFAWKPAHDTAGIEGKPTGNQVCLKEIPAKYETLTKMVIKTPASFRTEKVPAVEETVKVRKLVAQASENRTKIPAEYKTVSKRTKVGDERLEWRQVLCQTNMTKDVVAQLQQALQKAGYNPGGVDGVLGGGTLRAVDEYQVDKDLPRGGLTIRTLETLGVKI